MPSPSPHSPHHDDSTPSEGSLFRNILRPDWICGVALAVWAAWVLSAAFRSHANWMNFEADDFFYYLKIAVNMVEGKGSTFNGLVATNGYNPLWQWMIAGFVYFDRTQSHVLGFLAAAAWLALMSVYCLCVRILRRGGVPDLLAVFGSLLVCLYTWPLLTLGMEVTVTIPVFLALVAWWQSMDWTGAGRRRVLQGVVAGLLLSVVILARVDAAIFVALLVASAIVQPEIRSRANAPQVFGVCLGSVPVLAYFVMNRVLFDTWMPVSGMAKQLKTTMGFSSPAWRATLGLGRYQHINLLLLGAALLCLPFVWKRLRTAERIVYPAVLLFPLAHFAALSWRSDWILWDWYYYSFRVALCVALVVLLRAAVFRQRLPKFAVVCVIGVLLLIRIRHLDWHQYGGWPDVAVGVQEFGKMHPGIYAMGDRAGLVGYLLPQPLMQTEGLVMDKSYLSLVQHSTPLREVLQRYNVRYYIGFSPEFSGCFHAVEPAMAGPDSPRMRGEFCEAPVAKWVRDGSETVIYDLQPDGAR